MAKAKGPGPQGGGGARAAAPGPSGGQPRARRTPLQALLYWSAVAGVWLVIFAAAFLAVFAYGLPDTSKLYQVQRQPSISYLDRSGGLVAVRGSQFAPPVKIDELPPYVPAAFVAIEDRRFYHHFGFDPIGMVRMVFVDLRQHSYAQGASTITQQLARNLFLTPAQNMHRKAQELVLAIWLEAKFSKKQILALYLNRVYFGAGAYGIEAAAQRSVRMGDVVGFGPDDAPGVEAEVVVELPVLDGHEGAGHIGGQRIQIDRRGVLAAAHRDQRSGTVQIADRGLVLDQVELGGVGQAARQDGDGRDHQDRHPDAADRRPVEDRLRKRARRTVAGPARAE